MKNDLVATGAIDEAMCFKKFIQMQFTISHAPFQCYSRAVVGGASAAIPLVVRCGCRNRCWRRCPLLYCCAAAAAAAATLKIPTEIFQSA